MEAGGSIMKTIDMGQTTTYSGSGCADAFSPFFSTSAARSSWELILQSVTIVRGIEIDLGIPTEQDKEFVRQKYANYVKQ